MCADDSEARPLSLFVSYHRADDDTYNIIGYLQSHIPKRFKSLTGNRLEMFIDKEMPGGAAWRQKIPAAARACDFFLPLLSVAYLGSGHCRDEMRWFLESRPAREHGTSIVPITLIEGDRIRRNCPAEARSLLDQIDAFNWVDASSAIDAGLGHSSAAQVLLRRIVADTLVPFWEVSRRPNPHATATHNPKPPADRGTHSETEAAPIADSPGGTRRTIQATLHTGAEHRADFLPNASEEDLFWLCAGIEANRGGFLIVEDLMDPTGQTYIQILRHDAGTYRVEHRVGGPEQYFGTVVQSMAEARAMVTDWALDVSGWQDDERWEWISP